ncbi:MAG TPA: amino acid adenylation domain-containing protein [Pyrinomonadaceae bacterium]|jgi:amino acid adenylation domain-containing protein
MMNTQVDGKSLAEEKQRRFKLLLAQKGIVAPQAEPIGRRLKSTSAPLSFAQQRLWFLDKLEPGSAAYNLSVAVQLNGHFKLSVMERALSEIVRRHEVLRTTFREEEGQPLQVIHPARRLRLPVVDLTALSPSARDAEARRLANEEALRPFNLTSGPLMRACLLRLADEEYVALFTMHHIVTDGWSMGVLVHELATLYKAFSEGNPSPLPELRVQYADFAEWQREKLSGQSLDSELDYWKKQLSGSQPTLELPFDYPRPLVQSYHGAHLDLSLPAGLCAALRSRTQQEGCTLFMTLAAAFQALLYRYTGENDISIGFPVAGRSRPEVEPLIGFFLNTLVLRSKLDGAQPFSELLRQVKESAVGAQAHQDVPFELLVEHLQPERSLSHTPLFQVMFNMLNYAEESIALPELALKQFTALQHGSKFDLTLYAKEAGEFIHLMLVYNTDLFETSTIRQMLGHFQTLLEGIASEPERPISQLPLLSEPERRQLLLEWNDTRVDYPSPHSIQGLIEAQVAAAPQSVAVICGQESLSYLELDRRANQLAFRLQRHGVGPDVIVGVCLGRSIEMVVALLGILKAGGAFMQLDPAYPAERLAFMLEDTNVPIVLTQERLRDSLPPYRGEVLCLDDKEGESGAEYESSPGVVTQPEHLAYLFYTSGSTGKPKGVMTTQRGAVNFLRFLVHEYELSSADVILQMAALSFDASVRDILGPLTIGAQVVLLKDDVARDPQEWLKALKTQAVTCLLSVVPTMLNSLIETAADRHWVYDDLRLILCSGESLPLDTCRRARGVFGERLSIVNLYGPTECTMTQSFYHVGRVSQAQGAAPVGRPIANTDFYLLDKHYNLVPVGVAGEVYIGGDGLARGYLNRADLTAQMFVPHPFSPNPGMRLYRTGDRARYLRDGNIELLGRLDQQVKIRGQRVEPAEIEATLSKLEEIREAAVIAREEVPGEKYLVAYIVPAQAALNFQDVRKYLRERLPEYMIPAAFVEMERLPLTPNGKVDRRSLPAPDRSQGSLAPAYVAPRSPVEEVLANIWIELLGVDRAGRHDNFFELGGHSLLATRLVSRISATLLLDLPLRALFEHPTISQLAACIERELGGNSSRVVPQIVAAARNTPLPLSFAQQRLWFLDKLEPGSPLYNMPMALRLKGELNSTALEMALSEIVRRHEVLRTHFEAIDGQPLQLINPPSHLHIPLIDLSALPAPQREASVRQLANTEAALPFDLERAPLLRATLLRLSATEHVLLFTMHHIISDAWSMALLVREVASLYTAFIAGKPSPLRELPIQYADYAVWQREWLSGEVLDEQLQYWREQLDGAPTELSLPTDHPRPPVQSSRGATQRVVLGQGLSEELRELSRREGVTLFMTLLAGWSLLLGRYAAVEDVLVGTPIAGRTRAEVEDLIGFFVNTLVMRVRWESKWRVEELLKAVREVSLGGYSHQEVPFERLVEEMQVERSLSRSPLFQVAFVLQNAPVESLELPGLTLSGVEAEDDIAKFDMTLSLIESEGTLWGGVEYNADLFEATTIKRLIRHYETLLEGITAHPEQRLSQLSLLTAAERQQLLADWNNPTPIASNTCIHHLFEAQASHNPEQVAVVSMEGQQLSYGELNARANQAAHYFRRLCVGPETVVSILMERSIEMMVALLGVLKAGGAYLPLDPAYPQERVAFILEDSGSHLVLTQERLRDRLPDGCPAVVSLDAEWDAIARESVEDPKVPVAAENQAYVIYTSGSTGQPKGVVIQHSSLSSYIQAARIAYESKPSDRFLQFFSISFDGSAEEIYVCLTSGATLFFRTEEMLGSTAELMRNCQRWGVTVLSLPTAYWHEMTASLERERQALPSTVRLVIIGGERALPERLLSWQKLAGERVRLVHTYGPTEATIVATMCDLQDKPAGEALHEVPIGRAVRNAQTYVLDERLDPVPAGVPGQLYLGGECLARGYLNHPQLTAEKFIPDAFSRKPGARLYATGDRVRYLADGNLEFLGRFDQQVKVRGFRIELGEIEAVLTGHDSVHEAVVVAREDVPGNRVLVAYLVAQPGATLNVSQLRETLKERLAAYMIPSAFVEMERLPLTPSGKLNRRALPAPATGRADAGRDYVAPSTPTEEMLASIWAGVLNLENVSVQDNFFELGGHSLLATQLISRIRETFQVELPVRQLFEEPTVAGLARHVEFAKRDKQNLLPPAMKRVDRSLPLPLSFAQQRLWFISQLHPLSPLYNLPLALHLRGNLNLSALTQTFSHLVSRHESLRTTFTSTGAEPRQLIHPPQPCHIPLIDLSHLPEQVRAALASSLLKAAASDPFDLSTGPLLRVLLLRLSPEEHALLLVMHHIISDGWSLGVMVREVSRMYESYVAGEIPQFEELQIQYADYAVWQREWLSGEVLERELEYWREQLRGSSGVLEVMGDRVRPAVISHRGGVEEIEISVEEVEGLRRVSRGEAVTMFMLLLAAWQALLFRYSGQTDIVVGADVANRNRKETEGLIGFFVNMLVLRANLSGEPTFREFLKQIRDVCLEAYAHQDMPFEKLVEELQPERSLSRTPLFQAVFVLQNAPVGALTLPGLQLSPVSYGNDNEGRTAKFDLLLSMQETAGGLSGSLEYSTDLFDATTIRRMVSHLQNLLTAVLEDIEQRVSMMPLLSEAERRQLLFDWNDTQTAYPAGSCIQHLFEEQAAQTPHATALVSGDEQMSYDELNRRANQLAHYLQSIGVGQEITVGLCVERSIEMVVALLGILKASGAYVPLDPTYPLERLSFMIEDAAISVLITQERLLDLLPVHWSQVVCLDTDWPEIARHATDNPQSSMTAENLAYLMYTSGSTGQPKGVSVTHRNVVRLVKETNYATFGPAEVFLQLAPISFDASTFEIWGSLLHGAKLVLMPAGVPTLEELGGALRSYGVTTLWLTAGLFHLMVDERLEDLSGVRQLLAGGDALSASHVRRKLLEGGDGALINGYGPTESTTFACCYEMTSSSRIKESVPIGRPIANTEVYVLDKVMQPAPVGVPGELYIGGDGLARGYHERPQLTAERFLPHPFSREAGARLYRTGDRVRYLTDGRLEFLGRLDSQVKLRGFRIELGEIEAVLNARSGVREAVVNVLEEEGRDKRLIAYVVADEEAVLKPGDLRRHLQERLPDYMIPSAFVLLDSLPLTPNGKVDRRALPAPDQSSDDAQNELVETRTPTEDILASIWSEVLRIAHVGLHDDFFELGGHSLLATQVISRVRAAFGVEIALRQLFEQPNVAGLASVIEQALRLEKGVQPPAMKRVDRSLPLPLSFAQQRLWFISQLHPLSPLYNLPLALHLRGHLDLPALSQTFSHLVSRHESLRTTFTSIGAEPVQLIHPPQPCHIPLIDLSHLPEQVRAALASSLLKAAAADPFDLSTGPLLRVLLLRLSPEEHALLLVMHHIISDGWSLGVMVREVSRMYESYVAGEVPQFEELQIQYADYAVWQREWLSGEVLERELEYWREQLRGSSGVLEVMGDRVRPAVISHRGGVEEIEISVEEVEGLRRVSRGEAVTMFMLLLAAWQALLFRYSGDSDVPVGTPIANRNRKETEGLIGFFVNTLVIRSRISGEMRFTELLKQVRDTALGAYAHQDMPFEKLVEELQPERSLSHEPLFQVMFVLQNAPVGALRLPGLQLSPVQGEIGGGTAKFDLTLEMQETAEGLSGSLEYSTDIFESTTIKRMIGHFLRLLESIVADRQQPLSEIPLLSDAERRQVLAGWNQTATGYTRETCLHQLFEAQVKRTPDALAIAMNGHELTYAELNARAHRLALYLQGLGVGPDVLVGICVERSLKMVVGLLGILKAGGAYVPLDPAYPKERLALMLEDSGTAVLLTEERLLDLLPEHKAQVVCLDDRLETDAGTLLPDHPVEADNLAYVIYTSGSTGRPKGVQISHRAVVNFLCSMQREPGINASDRLLAVTSLSFDIAALELYLPLTVGAGVIIADRAVSADGVRLQETLRSCAATIMQATPATWRILLEAGWEGEAGLKILCGGEALPTDLARQLVTRGASLWNLYGPTETTIWSAAEEIRPPDAHVSLGSPIANTQLYLLDSRMRPVPVGVAGELYIGGDGLARGYLKQPALTAERFVPHPFAETAGERLYRTGDLARRTSDGRLEFLGRLDSQVKLRGFRIELGEIEALLSSCQGVRQCVVVLRGETADTAQLVAYLVPENGTKLSSSELRGALAARLPEYMMPSAFVEMERLPLTPNGKVDRRSLPAPDRSQGSLAPAYVAPRDIWELQLTQIWEKVLSARPIGVTSNFFELGGHSLLVVRLMEFIKERWEREIPLATLFQYPTIEKLARLLRDRAEVSQSPLVCLQPGGSKRPFFCIHPIGGSVFHYVPLAFHLGEEQPLYGLQSQGLDGDLPPLTRIEEMAASYLDALRTVQPDGPYRLGGWSMGGIIAFEMAQQLQARGQEVELLILIDSTTEGFQKSLDLDDEWTILTAFAETHGIPLENLDIEEESLRRLGLDELLPHVLEEVRAAQLIPPDIGISKVRQILKVFRANMKAIQSYRPRPLNNRVRLIWAVDSSIAQDKEDSTLGWSEFAEVEAVPVQGNHFTLLREPHVESVAQQLKIWLEQVPSQDI